MGDASLEGRRILVVGASSGIGRSFAVRSVGAGANVVLAARRKDRLDEAIDEAGGGSVVCADVRDPDDCERIVREAVAVLGAIDLLLYSVGYAPMRRFAETTADDWRAVLEANVIGAHQVIRAAIPVLAPGGVVAVLSSETVGQPRSLLGAYNASKAALEESLNVWRTEHPRLRFVCVAVGATQPTEFGNAFEPELLATALQDWTRHGLSQEDFMATDDLADVLIGTFAVALTRPGIGIERVVARPPSPVVGSADALIEYALGEQRAEQP